MWVYRNLCTCFALPRDETYFERQNLISSMHPLSFMVLAHVEVVEWTCEEELIRRLCQYGPLSRRVTQSQIVSALLTLIADGKIERRFIALDTIGDENQVDSPVVTADRPAPHTFQFDTRTNP